MRRALVGVVLALGVIVTGGLGAGGWYYSDQLLPAPPPFEPVPDMTVTDVDAEVGMVTLAADGGDPTLYTIGLVWESGLLVANGGATVQDGETVRTATVLDGEWPAPGDLVATTVDTFFGDPATTLGLPYDPVMVPSALGDLPAWRVVPNGADTTGTWVVIIHGRGGALSEGNRLLPVLADEGLPSLTISVRNDLDAPADPDGFGYYGEREWEELEAAIDHLVAVEQASEVVLAGFSQGASIALSLLRRSDRAELVSGAVLVSPLVSLDATLELQARNRDIPEVVIPPLLASTRVISSWRSGLDFGEVEHLARADELPRDIPYLLTHGTADSTVPVAPTEALAAELGAAATYVAYEDVEHVREWNHDPLAFEQDLRELLSAATQ